MQIPGCRRTADLTGRARSKKRPVIGASGRRAGAGGRPLARPERNRLLRRRGVPGTRLQGRRNARRSRAAATGPRVLETDELTVLTGWAEAAAEALAYAPERGAALLADACPGASWRAALGIPRPSARLTKAIECLARALAAVPSPAYAVGFDAVLTATRNEPPGEPDLDGLARRVLRSALEQIRVHQARQAA